jgi:hypothetical protein
MLKSARRQLTHIGIIFHLILGTIGFGLGAAVVLGYPVQISVAKVNLSWNAAHSAPRPEQRKCWPIRQLDGSYVHVSAYC